MHAISLIGCENTQVEWESVLAAVNVSFTGEVLLRAEAGVLPIKIGGVDVTNRLWQLAGAFDGSILTVKIKKRVRTVWGTTDAVVLSVEHEYFEVAMVREILSVPDQGATISVMHNVEFYLRKEYQGQGIGAHCLAYEAMAAFQLEFSKIVANAANHPDVGWKVWPRLGYDAIVDPDILQKMQDELTQRGVVSSPGGLRISDLWDQGHFDLWEKYGTGCMMEFDVSSRHSWSMQRIRERIHLEG